MEPVGRARGRARGRGRGEEQGQEGQVRRPGEGGPAPEQGQVCLFLSFISPASCNDIFPFQTRPKRDFKLEHLVISQLR